MRKILQENLLNKVIQKFATFEIFSTVASLTIAHVDLYCVFTMCKFKNQRLNKRNRQITIRNENNISCFPKDIIMQLSSTKAFL